MRLPEDSHKTWSGEVGVGIVFICVVEAALIEWTSENSRLSALKLKISILVSYSSAKKCCLFVLSAYVPMDCSHESLKGEFYHDLQMLLSKAPPPSIVMIAREFNVRVS